MGFTEEIHRGNLDQMCLNIINKYPFLTVYSWITELLGRDGVDVGNTSVVPEQKSLSPSLSLSLSPSLSPYPPLSLSLSLSLTHTHRSVHLTSGNAQLHRSYTNVRHVFLQTEISKCYKKRRGRKLENKGTGVKKEVCGLGSESLSIQGPSVDQIHGRLMSINITGP